MIARLNCKQIFVQFFAFIFFYGILSVAVAEDEYCPPEMCEEEVVEEVVDVEEDCPPEMCEGELLEEVIEEIIEEEEDCPPEFCDDVVEETLSTESTAIETEEDLSPVDRTLYSRLTGAMRDNMYQHVTYDDEIDEVEQWIADGKKNDDVFTDTVLPIMKENCSKCHSTSSTMTKGIKELPLTNYEEIVLFTSLAPSDTTCLNCHGDDALNNSDDLELAALYVSETHKNDSAHKDVPCARCHYDLHDDPTTLSLLNPSSDVSTASSLCLQPEAFSAFVGAWSTNSEFDCEPLQRPACAKCHTDVGTVVAESIHFPEVDHEVTLLGTGGEPLTAPGCIDCHASQGVHNVVISAQSESSTLVSEGCGSCHADLAKTYFDSYHGKAALLGSTETAQCFDCHGSHEMVSLLDEKSPVHENNLEETCSSCHEDTNENFADFIPHANYHDADEYPVLFYTFWAMNGLLFGVFVFFGIHTALWFYRSIQERKEKRLAGEEKLDPTEQHVRRFNVSHTIMHLMVITSFLTLALTGMTLKFSDNSMFVWISDVLGGPEALGEWHRIGAMVTGAYFSLHLMQLVILFAKKKITIMGLFKEDYTMVPLLRDVQDAKANILYFVGKGPKPQFGRWTYWEKFDYLAVFWGVAVIGLSGLMLWFPEVVTRFVPGWIINVAYIVHGEEALLATIFIFVAHFFHTHLRPESVPLDPVVFTQGMPLSKFKEERPQEYKKLVEKNELEDRLMSPPTKWYMALVYLFGFSFVAIGLFLVVAILYSMMF